jgi:CheY-like chemotaxis protein
MDRPRILVIEDNTVARLALVELLGNAGYEVLDAATAEVATPLATEFQPQIVLCSLVDGGLEQETLLSRFAALESDPYVIFCDVRARSGRRGRAVVLPKPIDLNALLDALSQARRSLSQPE